MSRACRRNHNVTKSNIINGSEQLHLSEHSGQQESHVDVLHLLGVELTSEEGCKSGRHLAEARNITPQHSVVPRRPLVVPNLQDWPKATITRRTFLPRRRTTIQPVLHDCTGGKVQRERNIRGKVVVLLFTRAEIGGTRPLTPSIPRGWREVQHTGQEAVCMLQGRAGDSGAEALKRPIFRSTFHLARGMKRKKKVRTIFWGRVQA